MTKSRSVLIASASVVLGALCVLVVLLWLSGHAFLDQKDTILSIVVSLMTPMIAATAGVVALLSFRINRDAAIGQRYQKAVELLASDKYSTSAGAMTLMSQVAHENSGAYLDAAIVSLSAFIAERSEAAWLARRGGQPPPDEWERQALAVRRAIWVLIDLHTWGASIGRSRRLFISRAVIDSSLGDVVLAHAQFHECVFDVAIFERSTLTDVRFFGYARGGLSFEHCVLKDVPVHLVMADGTTARRGDEVNVLDCRGDIDDTRPVEYFSWGATREEHRLSPDR